MPVRVIFEQNPDQKWIELPDIIPGEERGLGNMRIITEHKSKAGHMIVGACDAEDEFGVVHYTDDNGRPHKRILTTVDPAFRAGVSHCVRVEGEGGLLLLRFYRPDETDSEPRELVVPPGHLEAEAEATITS